MTFVVLLTKAQFELKLYIAALAKDLQDVEDILQETNADIWRKAGSYDPSRPFLPWAKTLAKFQVLRWRKDRERDRLVLDDSSLDLLPADELEGVDLDLQMWALRRSLRRLPGDAFALIREKYAERRSIPDLARTFRLTEKAVVSRLYRIRKTLYASILALLKQNGGHGFGTGASPDGRGRDFRWTSPGPCPTRTATSWAWTSTGWTARPCCRPLSSI